MAEDLMDALHCDKCYNHTPQHPSEVGNDGQLSSKITECNSIDDCLWTPKNNDLKGECSHKCKARLTKGECEQYQEFNKSSLSPVIYDFSGNDNECIWHPNDYSMDETHSSMEGVCRAKDSKCFETPPTELTASADTSLGEVYCGYYYGGHDKKCYNKDITNCDGDCELYTDPRMDEFNYIDNPINKGFCVSDGKIRYDLETGEELGLIKTDEECSQIKEAENCIGEIGNGCLWEPVKQYCIPKVPQPNVPKPDGSAVTNKDMYDSCKPIDGHLPGNYDLNLLEEEGINVSEYRDRDNKKFPYYTSKYLCDVCSIRDNDLDNMYKLNQGANQDELNYYMLKDYVFFDGFGEGNIRNPSDKTAVTPEQYCEKEIDDTHDVFNPCTWLNDDSNKGGKCSSKCSQHSPVDNNVVTARDLKNHKEQCISDRWFPEESFRDVEFPNLNRDSEDSEDYFNDRYCTWDGFECHNSIPCKFAQQTRCEDLGYDWYEGSALDIMENPGNIGIPLDLSSSYPILRKGDGKPVEGDMEGVCIYPNVEAPFVSHPADYIVNPEYVGEQVIMIKWREYGTGWWQDMSCMRKMSNLDALLNDETSGYLSSKNTDNYFLGENVALIPFKIEQGDKCGDIMMSINNALQSYQYFVYNGEWVMHAEDLVEAIERSYDSSIDEPTSDDPTSIDEPTSDDPTSKYIKNYGYMYYASKSLEENFVEIDDDNKRKILNAIYDLRGSINILPVIDGKCVLQVKSFNIDSNTGSMKLEISPTIEGDTHFQFVEFIGTEIFSDDIDATILDSKLTLTVLSKYHYTGEFTNRELLPENMVQGYGTLYENKYIKDIKYENTFSSREGTIKDLTFNINNIDPLNSDTNNLDEIKKGYIDTIESEYPENDKNELNNWAAYRIYKNNNIFSQPTVEIKDELYKLKYNTQDGKTRLCSGSIETWKYINTMYQRNPTYQTVKLKNVNGLLKMMARYLDGKTNTIPSYFVPDDLYNRGETDGTIIDEYIDSYQQKEITKAVLWSITRNTPPFWGNLYYERGSLEGSEPLYLDSCGNFNIIPKDSGDENKTIYKDSFNENIRENTLIRPFADLDGSNNYIKWKNLMSYTGGNKRAIQLSRNVESTDFSLDSTDFNLYYLSIMPYIELSKKEFLLRSLNDWNRLTYRPVLGPTGTVGQDDYDEGCGTSENFGSGRTLDIPNIVVDDNGTLLKNMSIVDSYNYISNGDNFNKYFKDEYLKDHYPSDNYDDDGPVASENFDTYQQPRSYCRTYSQPGPNGPRGNQPHTIYINSNYEYNVDWYTTDINDRYHLTGKIGGDSTVEPPVDPYIKADITGGINQTGSTFIPELGVDGYYGWLFNNMGDEGCGSNTTKYMSSMRPSVMECCGLRAYPDCNIIVEGNNGLPVDHIFGVNLNNHAGTYPQPGDQTSQSYNWMTGGTGRTRSIPLNIPDNELGYPVNYNEGSTESSARGEQIIYYNNLIRLLKNDIHLLNRLPPYADSSDSDPDFLDSNNFSNPGEEQFYDNYLRSIDGREILYNNLYYPDDFTDETPDEGLRKWCMSNDASIDADLNITYDNTVYTSMNGSDKKIDPDNPENSMGILYSGWLNNYESEFDSSNKELFYSNKDTINAYRYPDICEPWRLKIGTDADHKAKYSNDIIFWDESGELLTFNSINSDDINYGDHAFNNLDKVFTGIDETSKSESGYIPYTSFASQTAPIQVKPNTLINRDDDKMNNKFYHMLYPTSIELAKPREKFIYVDITPNNDIFNVDTTKYINIYYFIDTLITNYPDLPSATPSAPGATPIRTIDKRIPSATNNIYGSIVNQYDYYDITSGATQELGKFYWLHPGLSETSTENQTIKTKQTALISEGEIKTPQRLIDNIGTNGIIVGCNNNSISNTNPSSNTSTPNDLKANQHVAYFYYVKQLTTPQGGADALLSSFTFNNEIFQYNGTHVNDMTNSGITDGSLSDNIDELNLSTTKNELFYRKDKFEDDYYGSRLPPKSSITKSIDYKLFGTGFDTDTDTTNQISLSTELTTLIDGGQYLLPIVSIPSALKYFNVGMVFDSYTSSELSSGEKIICEDLIKSKLSRCGNPYNWIDSGDTNKDKCRSCFNGDDEDTSRGLCGNFPNLISGYSTPEISSINPETPDGVTALNEDGITAIDLSKRLGVCGVLSLNQTDETKTPWDFIDVTHEPEDYGVGLPDISPYSEERNCNNLSQRDNPITLENIDFISLFHAGTNIDSPDYDTKFFKSVRNDVSDIFEAGGSDNIPYGCIRTDLSLIDNDKIKLSCNTNLSSSVERDKHVLINFIIEHTDELNTSDRTKLAIMSNEELLNKALELNIDISLINEYTRPKVYKKLRDVKIDNVCEKSGNYCEDDSDCDGSDICGRYEQWNDLQSYYYNIDNDGPLSKGFTMRKEWYMGGCGIDLNYSDSSSGESICKDKYPGLCEKNVDKCTSDNTAVREAIMLDCPETCQVQYTDFDRYKTDQIGGLSICTARGRCKWSQDKDESNLLPPCEEHTTREMGSVEKCRKYNLGPSDGGPDAGSCNLDDYSQTLASPICAEQRCTSMQGCLFTKPKTRYCRVESYVDDRIVNEEDCPGGSRWIGASTGGQCIMPYKEFYDSDLQDFEQDCSILGGTIIDGQEQSCEYIPDLPYTGEDPCTHLVDLDDLTEDEQRLYLFASKGGVYIDKITPESFDGEEKEHPDYIKIILNTTLSNANINDFENLELTGFPRDKYIYIGNNTDDNNSICSQYLLGKSKIVKIADKDGKTEIIIGGPNKAYILPRHTEDSPDETYKMGDIDIGGSNACELMGIYDIESYFTNNTNDADTRSTEQRKSDACYYNPRGACNYETSSDGSSGDCVSCALYEDEVSCFGNNDTNEYSRCGWGSIKDMCGVIGEMDECKKMHIDGCEWDPAKETCSLNKLTDDDGNPLVDKVGCVKCDDIGHRNTCNSMKNCFWDRLTVTDDGIGRCRACSNIGDPNRGTDDPNKDIINFSGLSTDPINMCDDYQLTEGQCEFRNPENRVSGLDTDLHIFSSEFGDMNSISGKILNSWKIIFDDVTGQANEKLDDNECLDDDVQCKCSPTRLYPLFPDWIIHNLIFLLIFGPFIAYFGYAWYKVLISPAVFNGIEIKDGGPNEVSTKPEMGELLETLTKGITKKFKKNIEESSKDTIENIEETLKDVTGSIKGGSNKIGTRYKLEGMKGEYNISDIFSSGPESEFTIKVGKGKYLTSKFKGFIEVLGNLFSSDDNSSKDKNFLMELFNETINPMMYTKGSKFDWFKAQFHYLTPSTNPDTTPIMSAPFRDWRNLNGIFEKAKILVYVPVLLMNPISFLKLLFVIISFPFTLLQILANNVRLSIPMRVASIFGFIKKKLALLLNIHWAVTIFVSILILVCIIAMVASLVIVTVILVKYGITCFLELTKTGVLPNKNYVDPIDGITHKDENTGTIYPAAAVWPRRLYREEWDDMIKDPISDEVVQQRESLLPDILQGSINDKDNVTDAYKIAYMELEPESLNWTQSLRNIGTYYNNFVNRLGDNFLFTFILAPYIIYKYITSVSDYFPKEGEVFQIKDVLLYTVGYAIIFGVVSVIMTRSDPAVNEYDGVEKKCYDDIPSPFSLGDGSPINYPKLCYGDSLDEGKDECPYGCYYIGDGTFNADGRVKDDNPDYGKKCKDNRSGLSLAWIFEPEPRLNIPISGIDIDDESKGKWHKDGPAGKQYACPPKSRFLGKYPYDSLCATTAKRCKAADSINNLIIDSDDFCESLYMLNNHNDTQCHSSFIDGDEMTQSDYLSKSDELARGPITENGIEPAVRCELHTPYTSGEGYSTDKFCPFPLPAGENDLLSQSSDPEDNLRSSIPLWTYLYDKITNRTTPEICTYLCENPDNCTLAENTFRDYCNNVDMYSDSSKTPEEICITPSTDGRNCRYFPENIPLQMSMQNQERYYIVNQEYGQNLFS